MTDGRAGEAPGAGTGTDLARSAARGAATTTAARAVRIVVQIAGLVVLARLLTPEDYGLVAIVGTLAGVAELLRDFGLSNAAIQAPVVTAAQRSNLHWVNLGLGVLFAGAMVALAEPIADAFGNRDLVGVVRWMAVVVVLNSWATQYRAALSRDLRFTALATLEIVSLVVGTALAVVLAWQGWGYWALVAMQLLTAAVMCVGSTLQGGWWPQRFRRGVPLRSFLRFGSQVFAAQLLGYASRNVDTIVAGLRFGVPASGLYNRAFQLMAMPITQLTYPAGKVALPVLSRLQDDDARFERYLLRGQTVLLHALLPIVALVCALPEQIIDIALGPTWSQAAPILQILALGAFFEAANFSPSWVLQATGATGMLLRYTLVAKPLMIVLIVAGSQLGLEGIALGYAVGAALTWPLGLLWVRRVRAATARHLFLNGAVAVSGHIAIAACVAGVVRVLAPDSAWTALVVGAGTLAVVTALLALVWPAWRRGVLSLLWTVQLARARAGRPAR